MSQQEPAQPVDPGQACQSGAVPSQQCRDPVRPADLDDAVWQCSAPQGAPHDDAVAELEPPAHAAGSAHRQEMVCDDREAGIEQGDAAVWAPTQALGWDTHACAPTLLWGDTQDHDAEASTEGLVSSTDRAPPHSGVPLVASNLPKKGSHEVHETGHSQTDYDVQMRKSEHEASLCADGPSGHATAQPTVSEPPAGCVQDAPAGERALNSAGEGCAADAAQQEIPGQGVQEDFHTQPSHGRPAIAPRSNQPGSDQLQESSWAQQVDQLNAGQAPCKPMPAGAEMAKDTACSPSGRKSEPEPPGYPRELTEPRPVDQMRTGPRHSKSRMATVGPSQGDAQFSADAGRHHTEMGAASAALMQSGQGLRPSAVADTGIAEIHAHGPADAGAAVRAAHGAAEQQSPGDAAGSGSRKQASGNDAGDAEVQPGDVGEGNPAHVQSQWESSESQQPYSTLEGTQASSTCECTPTPPPCAFPMELLHTMRFCDPAAHVLLEVWWYFHSCSVLRQLRGRTESWDHVVVAVRLHSGLLIIPEMLPVAASYAVRVSGACLLEQSSHGKNQGHKHFRLSACCHFTPHCLLPFLLLGILLCALCTTERGMV